MKIIDIDEKVILESQQRFCSLPFLKTSQLKKEKTVLVIVDVINGFIREGVLHDSGIENIIPPISEFLSYCNNHNIKSLAFSDCHSKNASEFSAFPPHCIMGSEECKIVHELTKIGGFEIIEKNSVNGFHAPEFQKFLGNNKDKNCYVVCGDCTDICVLNFCLSLKTYFNQSDINSEVILPVNMVETYDSPVHNRDFANISALSLLETNGIKLTGGIEINE